MKKFATYLSLLGLLASVACADFEYRIEPDNSLTITNYTGGGGDISVPELIDGHRVAEIGPAAFADCDVLAGITLPASVVTIGAGAFRYCYNLASVNLGNGVAMIADYAFYSCTSLTNIVLGTNVSTIGNGVFFYCGSLKGIAIPARVTAIGETALQNCSALAEIVVAEGNPAFASSNGVLFDKTMTTLIQCPGGKAGDYAIPPGVAAVGNEAFRYCYSLTGIAMPASLATIGEAAILNGPSLVAFQVDEGNADFSSLDGVLFNKEQSLLIQCPGGKIGSYAVPAGVTAIGDAAFYECSSLADITFPDSLTSIGNDAFYNCTALIRIKFGGNVFTIGSKVFFGCSKLEKVTIPENVASIGTDAFIGCAGLVAVCFEGNAPGAGDSLFDDGSPVVVFRRLGSTGWEETFAGQSVAIWPEFLTATIKPEGLALEIVASENQEVLLEQCLDLSGGDWQPVSTNTIVGNTLVITIPVWADDPMSYYRLALP